MPDETEIHPSAIVHPRAYVGRGTVIGPHAVIGPHVRIGANCSIGASAVIDGWTEIGDETEIFPFASIGLIPQDLKFKGEQTKLSIGKRNIFREFVTIHRGTRGGGGVTTIGDRNVFMAYVHVAHDCHVGNDTIFGHACDARRPRDRRGLREHQRRIGRAPVLPRRPPCVHRRLLGRDEGRAAVRADGRQPAGAHLRHQHDRPHAARALAPDVIEKLKRSFRYLTQSKLNTTKALQKIAGDKSLACAEVQYLVDFIRTSQRGVILRRATRKAEESLAEE